MLHACERVRVRVADHFLTIWHPDVPRNHVRASFFVARGRDPGDPLGMRGREAGKVCLFLTSPVILIVSFAFHASGGLASAYEPASTRAARARPASRENFCGVFSLQKHFAKAKFHRDVINIWSPCTAGQYRANMRALYVVGRYSTRAIRFF